jgi:hypothetical protein
MVGLGKTFRWFFALNSVLFGVIALRFAGMAPYILRHVIEGSNPHPRMILGMPAGGVIVCGGMFGYGGLAVVFGMAWWTLGKGKTGARAWALAASLALTPFWAFGSLAAISSGLGVMGLVVFWRRETVKAMGPRAAGPRLVGDGTSGALDWLATALMYGGVLVGGLLWTQWGEKHGLAVNGGLLLDTLMIELAAIIATGVHEVGHALTAIALKMKVRQFLLGPLEWRLRGKQWHFRFHAIGLLSVPGAVGVAPTSLEDLRWRRVGVCAAGPLASLVLGLAALWATTAAKGSVWEPCWSLMAYIATFSLLAFVINFIPIQPEGQYSDGARIYQLLARTPGSQLELAFAMVSSTVVSPLRPKDLDVHMLEEAAAFRKTGAEALLLRLNACTHFLDSGRTQDALRALEQAEAVYTESEGALPGDLRVLAHEAFTYGNAYLRRDAGAARSWWERTEAKSVKHYSADYWRAYCSLLWVENRLEEAQAAWASGNALAENCPKAGAYDYGRDCFARLRFELDAAAA